MANEVHLKKITATAVVNFGTSMAEVASLANDEICWSDAITTLGTATFARVWFRLRMGTGAVTDRTPIHFYWATADNHATELRGGGENATGVTATAGSATGAALERIVFTTYHVHTILVENAAVSEYYEGHFDIEAPGDDFNVLIHNQTDAAFSATGSDHVVHIAGYGQEIQ